MKFSITCTRKLLKLLQVNIMRSFLFSLESKLAERRAKMAEVRRKKEETLMNKAKANREEREKYQQQLVSRQNYN